ncbi:SMC-Scp complex subunit ScpB [Acidaminobacter hydrogenoformans]|uniref:Segregation and condensation protein B n=1 Tax=Acidaminobacter hydrogenoformans DSM 2784 TaxID=1120920 RepID=A0A1G5RRQ9_9FIRM|nr:SMC-Scp complex subunit ScpB [Acidaminobacter hydrogenoformans]SCZ76752.1 segregation and condensation protein B [Acidaminobacter hydrogenoformans DSM 2784]
MEERSYRSAIESILFVSGEPVAVDRLASALDLPVSWTVELLEALQKEYETGERGVRLLFIRDAVQMASAPENADYIERVMKTTKSRGLSPATLEALAIIAYKQPVTRSEIDYTRGVKSDKPLQILLERGLVEERGRLEKIGRPMIYGTTDEFLRTFGLRSLEELPDLTTFDGAERLINLLEAREAEEAAVERSEETGPSADLEEGEKGTEAEPDAIPYERDL